MEKADNRYCMEWHEISDLLKAGWHIGAHMHRHCNLDYLAKKDPSGGLIREELEKCDDLIYSHLGIVPKDFAYTGTTWSRIAENEVRKRYRFGRLWIVGTHYKTDEGEIRYADLVGILGDDEVDGGPPYAARYITEDSDPYRLPSMDLEYLIFEFDAFRRYLQGALEPETRIPFHQLSRGARCSSGIASPPGRSYGYVEDKGSDRRKPASLTYPSRVLGRHWMSTFTTHCI